GGRFRLVLRDFDLANFGRLVWRNCDQRLAALLFTPINREPTRILDNFPFGFERVLLHARDSRSDFELGRREKDAHKPTRDHVVNLLLHVIEAMRGGAGWNDGEVIGDFRIIENSRRMFDPLIVDNGAGVWIVDLA